MGFALSKSESSLLLQTSRTRPISILLYVDDLVIADADLKEIGQVKSQLSASFEMKDLGSLHYILRIEVIWTPIGISISQRHYVLNMVFKFEMADCKSVSTPLYKNVKIRQNLGMMLRKYDKDMWTWGKIPGPPTRVYQIRAVIL